VPLSFWADTLATATYLLNRRPCRRHGNHTPYELLFGATPSYDHLRVFGCRCYPKTAATAPHKLAPRSVTCIFLGYPVEQRGYRCYDPSTHRIITSRHVYFDEHVFPFAQGPSSTSTARAMTSPMLQELLPAYTPRRARTTRPAAPRKQKGPAHDSAQAERRRVPRLRRQTRKLLLHSTRPPPMRLQRKQLR
jgi:hypothetical protein